MTAQAGHHRLTSALRVIAAAAGLAVYLVDPHENPSRRPFALAVLVGFAVYALAVLAMTRRRRAASAPPLSPWIDVGWVTLLLAVSAGSSNVFFPLYLFAILGASFTGGFGQGMAVTLASALCYALVGWLTAPRAPGLDLLAFVFRPLYLLVVGYLTAAFGGHEVRARARLALLREVATLSNPRFGVDRTLARLLEAVRDHYGALDCRLVVSEAPGRGWMRSAARGAPVGGAVDLPPQLLALLLSDPPTATAVVGPGRPWWADQPALVLFDHETGARTEGDPARAAALATALEAGAVLAAPLRFHASAEARLLVTRSASQPFDRGDVALLRHVLDQVAPVLDAIRLVDRLAFDASEEERRRIARDLHDSVIQPYLGLRLGLSAARAALGAGRLEEATGTLDRLSALADGEIEALRHYVRDLRSGAGAERQLEESLRRFCRRFADATGVQVELTIEGTQAGGSVLGAELFQLVAEALSNVRRHTSARLAEVRIRFGADQVEVSVTNAGWTGAFHPRSMAERAEALGGRLRVGPAGGQRTTVAVEVPL